MVEITRRNTVGLAAAALASTTSVASAQGKPITIGFGMAETGGLAAGGKQALLTYQIWAEQVNKAGGLLGRPVKLVYYDDQSNPATVPGIYTKLLDLDKVDLVISGYATVPTAAALPIIIQRGKLFPSLFALGANDKFRYPRYFQIMPNGPDAKIEFSRGFFDLAGKLTPRPKTVALVGADAEFSINALEGARINVKSGGFKIVYDRTYPPNTIDFTSIVQSIKSTKPDLVFIASYPPDSAGMVHAVNEVKLPARMLGGGMIGPQFAVFKEQLGPLLNKMVCYELYVPSPTMNFPGIEDFLKIYRARAVEAKVDPLGTYLPPYAFAEMQVLGDAIKATGTLDDGKLAEYIHKTTFETVVGKVAFNPIGEWVKGRVPLVQFRDVVGHDIKQFMTPGKEVIVYPPAYKSGDLVTPYAV